MSYCGRVLCHLTMYIIIYIILVGIYYCHLYWVEEYYTTAPGGEDNIFQFTMFFHNIIINKDGNFSRSFQDTKKFLTFPVETNCHRINTFTSEDIENILPCIFQYHTH